MIMVVLSDFARSILLFVRAWAPAAREVGQAGDGSHQRFHAPFGFWTGTKSEGIRRLIAGEISDCRFDARTGKLVREALARSGPHPKCGGDRPATEINCEGDFFDEERCNSVSIAVPAVPSNALLPQVPDASNAQRQCSRGHAVADGDFVCPVCGERLPQVGDAPQKPLVSKVKRRANEPRVSDLRRLIEQALDGIQFSDIEVEGERTILASYRTLAGHLQCSKSTVHECLSWMSGWKIATFVRVRRRTRITLLRRYGEFRV
jgi:hypothetical protein